MIVKKKKHKFTKDCEKKKDCIKNEIFVKRLQEKQIYPTGSWENVNFIKGSQKIKHEFL